MMSASRLHPQRWEPSCRWAPLHSAKERARADEAHLPPVAEHVVRARTVAERVLEQHACPVRQVSIGVHEQGVDLDPRERLGGRTQPGTSRRRRLAPSTTQNRLISLVARSISLSERNPERARPGYDLLNCVAGWDACGLQALREIRVHQEVYPCRCLLERAVRLLSRGRRSGGALSALRWEDTCVGDPSTIAPARRVRESPTGAHGPWIGGAVGDARSHPRGTSARRAAGQFEPSLAGATELSFESLCLIIRYL